MYINKLCTRCGVTKPVDEFAKSSIRKDGRQVYCRECNKSYRLRYDEKRTIYRQNRRDRIIQEGGKICVSCGIWKATTEYSVIEKSYCRSCDAIKAREWRAQNPESARRIYRRHYTKDPDRTKLLNQAFHNQHKAKRNAASRIWQKENREKGRAKDHRRRARKMAAPGSYTPEQWTALCTWFGGVCLRCGDAGLLTVDHVVPLVHGGSNNIANLQPLCFSCNSSKKTKSTDYRPRECLIAFLEYIRCVEY